MFVSTVRDWSNIVRDRRVALGMTQEELAEKVGRTRQWVIRFETGHAGSASLADLLNVLDTLELDVEVTAETVDEIDPDPLFMDPSNPDPWEEGP